CYFYGKEKGFSEAVKNPTLIYPNIPDITIVGKYRIPKQTPEQIVNKLNNWLLLNGFAFEIFPNVVKLVLAREPEEARKKKKSLEKLQFFRDGFPEDLTLFLSQSKDENWLDVEAMCVPVMHRKMGQCVQFLFPRSSVDDARRLCIDFMKSTMHILGAEVLREPEPESSTYPTSHFDLLYNTPTGNNANKKAHELIESTAKRVLLTGWVDREFIGDLENARKRGTEVRIITKSPEGSDKTVKEDFKRLLVVIGKSNIKLNSRCHDRFLICDNKCLIGSMYYTEASKTRFESAIYTDDSNITNKLIEHFERIWRDPSSIAPT
ncbi:MAG: phospholipase D family protein, partial [Candidatus Jordarchaeaceae archaeon]